MTDEREQAWWALHDALPPGWRAGRSAQYDPGRRVWVVAAVNERTTGRGNVPGSVEGTGQNEVEAVRDLTRKLEPRQS